MFGILVIQLFSPPAAAADLFVNSRLEAQAGYESNRMRQPGVGDGASFWQSHPGIDVMVFGEQTETSLFLDYLQTQYPRRSFEAKDEASTTIKWRYFWEQKDVGISAGGGLYQDGALPNDNYTFWQARPSFAYTFGDIPLEWNLNGTLRQISHDEPLYTSAKDRVDTRADVRTGIQWQISPQLDVWVDLCAGRHFSDAPEADLTEFGGVMGCDFHPVPLLRMGAWAGYSARPHQHKVGAETQRDTPATAGAWATYRLRPWVELFASIEGESYSSTMDGGDYSWWRAGGGVKIVFEH